MVTAKIYVLEKQFDGFPKETDLKLVEEKLPQPKKGEFLCEAVYLSVDPYMRAYAKRLAKGDVFIGAQVAKIIESKHEKYPVGKYVVSQFGWRSHTISDGKPDANGYPAAMILPDFGDLPKSLALGVLGMPGNSAYFGFLEICKPKAGETVVITGAAGAVGSIVGQIAKIKGCTVIGVAGSDDKGQWLVDELNFDHFINYNTADLDKSLSEIAPQGVDCYFDNVGGEMSTIIMNHMNLFGRISVCGSISAYNDKTAPKVSVVQPALIFSQLKMEGFIVRRWLDRWQEGILQNKAWISQGKLKYRETVTEGFDNMFKAFTEMLKGGNTGKAIVKV